MKTVTQLFGAWDPVGDEQCFYCGGQCDQQYAASKVVKSSFTGLDSVTLSDWVCRGCVESMNEKETIRLACGEVRAGQKVRCYSWIITEFERVACTKSHREYLLAACLSPPDPPWCISITDSGQKQLLYRGVVNHGSPLVTVTLEGEPITYKVEQLAERLELCKRVCAATGKPAMKEVMAPQSQMRIIEHYDDESILAAWLDCQSEPLTRLAAWLCPPKEDCLRDYPAVTSEPSKRKHGRTSATARLFD